MNKGQSSKRPRGHRGNGRRPNGGRNANFESSGPQGKIRGTAYQVIEKYQALGRDALTFGDRVAAENFFQHAEHYYRVMVANGGADQRGGRSSGAQQNCQAAGEEQQPRTQEAQVTEEVDVEKLAQVEDASEANAEKGPKVQAEESTSESSEAEATSA